MTDESLSTSSEESSSIINDNAMECRGAPAVEEQVAKDSKTVFMWKIAVSLALLITSGLVVVSTYLFLSNTEENEFENMFQQLAKTLDDASRFRRGTIIESFESASHIVTSLTVASNQTWPYVQMNDLEVHFAHTRNSSFTEFVGFSPLVKSQDKARWEVYSVENQNWIQASLNVASTTKVDGEGTTTTIPRKIHMLENEHNMLLLDNSSELYAPLWQMSPPPFNVSIVNYNILSDPIGAKLFRDMEMLSHFTMSGLWNPTKITDHVPSMDQHQSISTLEEMEHPHTMILQPVYNFLDDENRSIVGVLLGVLSWDMFAKDLLPPTADGIICVIENTYGEIFSYEINGHDAFYIGMGDHHESDFEKNGVQVKLDDLDLHTDQAELETELHCHYTMSIYPSFKFRQSFNSTRPEIFTTAIALVFFITAVSFYVFVKCVYRHQRKIVTIAERTDAVVSSLFPAEVRDRLIKDINCERSGSFFKEAPKKQLKNYLHEEKNSDGSDDQQLHVFDTKPIADFFAETTVLFADIVGFTAWSSVREPSQVFQLLETIYHSFDQIAKRRRVFKVETVSDCYVAATGIPDPRKDHAVAMARFSRACLHCAGQLTKKMEVTLGPETGDLSMRFGIHSGPVTAGVLRGDKSRFQLFGDTVNTAHKMETHGLPGRIHISSETADLLTAVGKSKWIIPREDKVVVKGKGELQTFWLYSDGNGTYSVQSSNTGSGEAIDNSPAHMPMWYQVHQHLNAGTPSISDKVQLSDKFQRHIDWNVDQLVGLLKPVVARRNSLRKNSKKSKSADINVDFLADNRGHTVLEEVKEIIVLPNFDKKAFRTIEDPDSIELGPSIVSQLHDYVSHVCKMYRCNPFHNFEHANHVTMSVIKLLSRIVSPDDISIQQDDNTDASSSDRPTSTGNIASVLHDHTYGITSDPLTQFSVAFAALIHDVDHSGVPNSQLIKENSQIASLYKNKSVAEQNSVDLAWDLLMGKDYADLRSVIYSTESELIRFRQLVVNSVMATDIVDKQLKALRDSRWEKAFRKTAIAGGGGGRRAQEEDRNRKATIVIEHLIQASDVAHTMQHWHIYRKWNERFFQENYVAYKCGRAEKDPSEFWYKGEIGFFDFYIIPLAKKLKDCGVFGVSSDEYLNYALKNREEWVRKGESVVQEMLQNVQQS